ncbi:serine/threonine protein kinase [Nonomuraea sp. NBC_01738]|uniref:serine/threonine-protein kinase n=1 Tax=Nonomuraea sp. NBC_01738 TaxID=2976003 RepID=UPI002E112619|nr:serine/threonine protein kinase [Nonomuraea sp. NBC_01738]
MSKLGKVGPYILLERLGRGGMGEVYLAGTRRGERVALKVLRELVEDESARIRLEREVRALRRVESPYVAKVFDADLDCARPYLVMEYIEGATLLDLVRNSGPLDGGHLVELAQGIATALAITHAAGVIHRDLKPANILMSERGPVLIDYGIAQVLDATRLTMTGTFLGTPGYTAPEIFADEQVESPADIYAWAATVAFAATGRPTFGRGTAEAQMYAVLNGQADLKGVPVELLPLVRAALNREPGKRPTAALLADRLSRLAKATGGADQKAAETVAEVPAPRARTTSRARAAEAKAGATAEDVKTPPPRAKVPAASRTKAAGRTARTAEKRTGDKRTGDNPKTPAPRAARVRTTKSNAEGKPRVVRRRVRSDGDAPTTLPAGNTALLLLAVLAVPCVVASVIWPIATIGITTAFVVLIRTTWMGHWLVRNRSAKRTRVLLRVVSYPFVLAGGAVTALAWPGAPVALVAGGALWATGGGQIDSDWWQQAAPVTVAGVVFGVLCGAITGREIERVGGKLPGLRREGLRALAVLGGFVALCAAAVRAISLLL